MNIEENVVEESEGMASDDEEFMSDDLMSDDLMSDDLMSDDMLIGDEWRQQSWMDVGQSPRWLWWGCWRRFRDRHLRCLNYSLGYSSHFARLILLEILLVFCFLCAHVAYLYSTLAGGLVKKIGKRVGYMLHWDMALIVVLSLRNSIFQLLVGSSVERTVFWHAWLGYWTFCWTLVHAALFFVYWIWLSDKSVVGELAKSSNLCAVGSFVLFAIVQLCSLPFVRRRQWELFKCAHLLAVPMLVLLLFHKKGSHLALAMAVPLAMMAVDWLIRLWKLYVQPALSTAVASRRRRKLASSGQVEVQGALLHNGGGDSALMARAWLYNVEHGAQDGHARIVDVAVGRRVVRLEIEAPNLRWWPGAWVLLTVPALSRWQHPFSICSPTQADRAVLYVRALGDFTMRLYEMAKHEPARLCGANVAPLRIEGPYGQLALNPAAYRRVLLVCGGIGLGPMLSVVNDLRRRKSTEASQSLVRTTHLSVVWAIRGQDMYSMFAHDIDKPSPFAEQWTVYVTRKRKSAHRQRVAEQGDDGDDDDDNDDDSVTLSYGGDGSGDDTSSMIPLRKMTRKKPVAAVVATAPDSIEFRKGRPDFYSLLSDYGADASGASKRTALLLCGPESFVRDAASTASCLNHRGLIRCGRSSAAAYMHFDVHAEHYLL
jgi:predicted ferric reductase